MITKWQAHIRTYCGLRFVIIALALNLAACTTLNIEASPDSLLRPSALYSQQAPKSVKRYFVDGLYGQVHVRVATPAEPTHAASPPALVLLPPAPYSSDYFKSFMREMAKDRVVIAIDTPGFGDSARPKAPPSIAEFARNMDSVLNNLGLSDPVDMLGYHTGTLIAAEYAVQNPMRVRRLVLPGVPYFTGDAQAKLFKANAKPDTLHPDGSHLQPKWDFAAAAMGFGMSLARAQEHFTDAMQATPESGFAYYGVFSYPADKRFPKLSQPVLYITDSGSLRTATEDAHAVTPQSEIVYLDQYSKGMFDLGAADLARETRAFLDR